jgi:arylsulfatase A-like enzyme
MRYRVSVRRREFLATLSAGALQAQPARRPNIIFILADDLGYGDLGCYGQKQFPTPNIDRIATEGTRFTQAYAGATVCAPSRCSLMTGLHGGHARIRGNAGVALRPEDVTVAKVLKDAGYRTGIFGKWGLGDPGSTGLPNQHGFDEWFGYLNQTQAHSYYPDSLWNNDKQQILARNLGVPSQYSHDMFTEKALGFVDRNKANPFYLYLAYTIPHANNELGRDTGNGMEVPDDKPFTGRDWPQQEKNFAAMMTRLDRDVGRLMDSLKTSGIDDNTIVFFTSDNGPHREGGHAPEFFHSSGPLRGIKRDLYEGGIRVPMLVRWPGKVRAGATSDFTWAFWDFLPTAAELGGGRAPSGIDGTSVVPALMGRQQKPHEYLYWEFHEGGFKQAVRMGDWKGVRLGTKSPVELYDVKNDLGEKENVAAAHPDVVARIEKIMSSARVDSPEFPIREGAPRTKKK